MRGPYIKLSNPLFISQYFESTLIARGCEEDMTLAESRIKASAKFFGPSCKAGPWVADPVEDRKLSEFSSSSLCFVSICILIFNF